MDEQVIADLMNLIELHTVYIVDRELKRDYDSSMWAYEDALSEFVTKHGVG